MSEALEQRIKESVRNPEDAPGFHVWQKEDFAQPDWYENWKEMFYSSMDAWSVVYLAHADATPEYSIVLWDEEHNSFHNCLPDGSCNPPQHFDSDEQGDDE